MTIIDYRNWLETQLDEGFEDVARLAPGHPDYYRAVSRTETINAALRQLKAMDLA